MIMKRCLINSLAAIITTVAICVPTSISAAPVTANQAKRAARNWLSGDPALGCRLLGEVADARTCTPTNGASFHVVKMAEGGFVVMSADTTRAPVVAFSSGDDLEESDANPLWVLLKKDLAIRTKAASGGGTRLLSATVSDEAAANEAKWAKLLGGGVQLMSAQGIASVSDVRVAPLVQSKWGQSVAAGDNCFNCLTPNNYPCGCVATVGAQIMRYFRYPVASMPQFTNQYCAVNGTARTLTTQGGVYDWDQMPLEPSPLMTTSQRLEIGKLTSDIGICCSMEYASQVSGTGGYLLAEVFTNHFGYSNAMVAQWNDVDQSASEDMRNALISNLDAGLPVALSLDGISGGHEIVGDGYGYSDGSLYIHFNMGWSGLEDAWYAPPAMSNSRCDFSVLDGFVYNIFTNQLENGVICSGRVLDGNGVPGIYALILPAGSYTITAYSSTSSTAHAAISVTLQANVATRLSLPKQYSCPPMPKVNNICGQDLILSDIPSVAEPQFAPPSCLFYPSTNVTITTTTSGATIHYTLDGTEPTESSPTYINPIIVNDDVTIKARAWKSGMNPSVVVTATYTYDAAQGAPKGDYFADPIVITGANGSRVIADNSAYTEEAGEPQHTDSWYDEASGYYYSHYELKTVWYQWTSPGSGTMTFTTRFVNSEYYLPSYVAIYTGTSLANITRLTFDDDEDEDYYATVSFAVEQGTTYRIVGMSGYPGYSGTFTLTWSGNLTVASTETSTTEVPVPYTWLNTYFAGQGTSTQDYEVLANADPDGDGFTTWQEYLAGTDPTNATSSLQVSIRMEGMTPVIEWNTTNDSMSALGYRYVPKGKTNLADNVDFKAPVTGGHRFFKVYIEPIQ